MQNDIYEEAADYAGVPDGEREEVVTTARIVTHDEVMECIAERMHAVLMGDNRRA